jgi:large subunit ribosomal protein L7Ae
MTKAYVNFTVSAEVAAKTYEALQLAKQSGAVKKGANEVTKSVERGLATFVVLAEDVEPEEVVIHIPKLCEQKKIAYSYVPKKIDLGKAIGMTVPCAAVAVETQGTAANAIRDVVSKVQGVSRKEPKAEAPAAQAAAPAEKKPKKEKAQAQQTPTA